MLDAYVEIIRYIFFVAVFKSLHEILKASVLCDSKEKCNHLQVFLKFNEEI